MTIESELRCQRSTGIFCYVIGNDMWIDASERLPESGRVVFVCGDYTPLDEKGNAKSGFPKACITELLGQTIWSSNQWRGSVAINYWFDDDKT